MRIGIWAFFGLGNLGDDAIQRAVLQNITTRVPNPDVIAVCLDPEQVSIDFGITAYPIFTGAVFHPSSSSMPSTDAPSSPNVSDLAHDRASASASKRVVRWLKRLPVFRGIIQAVWRLKERLKYSREIYRCVASLDILIISGSGVLDDTWKGQWRRPFALFKWCMIAKLTRTPLAFISVGATSLNTRLGRYFGGKALGLAEFRSFRDQESADVARQIMSSTDNSDPVVPDLAFSLEVPSTPVETANPDRPIVGIGPIPFGDPRIWPQKDLLTYESYVSKVSEFVVWLTESGCQIQFILGHKVVDKMTVQDIVDHVHSKSPTSTAAMQQPKIENVEQLLRTVSNLDYVISSRFHGVLLPYLLRKPVVALSYNSKICNLMASVGQKKNCLDIESFTVTECVEAFENICRNQKDIRAQLAQTSQMNRAILEKQYDNVLALAR